MILYHPYYLAQSLHFLPGFSVQHTVLQVYPGWGVVMHYPDHATDVTSRSLSPTAPA